jgi:hypothetical protein
MTAKSQLGVAKEGTYGTYVAPTTFNEILSENIDYTRETLRSQGWRAGQQTYSQNRRKPGRVTGGGDISFEVANKGFGKWFENLFGAVAITTPGGGTLSRDQTFTLATPDALSLMIQKGVEDRPGIVDVFSFLGCKVTSGTFSCSIGGFLMFTPNIIIRDVDTAQTLGVASYPATQELFTFVEGALTIGGTVTPVKTFNLTVDRETDSDDFAFGSGLRRPGRANAIAKVTGDCDADFVDLVAFNRFKNATDATLVLLFQASIIEGALRYEVEITANVLSEGDTPKIEGPEESRMPIRFVAEVPTAGGEAITLKYRTTDTAV